MNQKLFAFWKYDLFPFVLGGEIRDMNEKGMVYIESYQGYFRPILILPLEEGKRVYKKIKNISSSYNQEIKDLRKTKVKEIIDICPQLLPHIL